MDAKAIVKTIETHLMPVDGTLPNYIGLHRDFLTEVITTIESLTAKAEQTDGVSLIAAERRRQINQEGWTAEHDRQHENGELALAAACYACPIPKRWKTNFVGTFWPWAMEWWKPTCDNRIRELTKAGALIAAEIDRLRAGREQG